MSNHWVGNILACNYVEVAYERVRWYISVLKICNFLGTYWVAAVGHEDIVMSTPNVQMAVDMSAQ